MARPDYDDGNNVLVRFDHHDIGTPKALRIFLEPTDAWEDGIWIPRSLIAHIEVEAGEVWVPEWLAREKGLEYE